MTGPESYRDCRVVEGFIRAEGLSFSPSYGAIERRLLEESGVLDLDPETIIEMKGLFSQWRAWNEKKGKR